MYSGIPKEKLPCLSNFFSGRLLSFDLSSNLNSSSAFFLRKVNLQPICRPGRNSHAGILFLVTVFIGSMPVIFFNSFNPLFMVSSSLPTPTLRVIFSILIFLRGFSSAILFQFNLRFVFSDDKNIIFTGLDFFSVDKENCLLALQFH